MARDKKKFQVIPELHIHAPGWYFSEILINYNTEIPRLISCQHFHPGKMLAVAELILNLDTAVSSMISDSPIEWNDKLNKEPENSSKVDEKIFAKNPVNIGSEHLLSHYKWDFFSFPYLLSIQ